VHTCALPIYIRRHNQERLAVVHDFADRVTKLAAEIGRLIPHNDGYDIKRALENGLEEGKLNVDAFRVKVPAIVQEDIIIFVAQLIPDLIVDVQFSERSVIHIDIANVNPVEASDVTGRHDDYGVVAPSFEQLVDICRDLTALQQVGVGDDNGCNLAFNGLW